MDVSQSKSGNFASPKRIEHQWQPYVFTLTSGYL